MVLLTIKNQHEDLIDSNGKAYLKNTLNYIFDRNRWWLIILGVIAIFYICLILNFEFLNIIRIDFETAKILVDQRTTNIVTVISITLVVVGFLISNLAVKEPFSYWILFKHSKLYPIIYFTLTTIGGLLIVSTLRSTMNPLQFEKAVIVGSYLVLIVLFLIGYLFRTIIHFTNNKRIEKLLLEELLIEVKLTIKQYLYCNYSYAKYEEFMRELGINKYNWAEELSSASKIGKFTEIPEEDVFKVLRKRKIVDDVNLKKLSELIINKKERGAVCYKELAIGNLTEEVDDYIWNKETQNTNKEKNILKKCLVLKRNLKRKKDDSTIRQYFDQKFEECVNENNYQSVEFVLNSYTEVYELYMKNI